VHTLSIGYLAAFVQTVSYTRQPPCPVFFTTLSIRYEDRQNLSEKLVGIPLPPKLH
jgi:hypothetical protein